MGLTIAGPTLYTLHYGNDQIVVPQDEEDLEFMDRNSWKNIKNGAYM